MIKGEAVDKIIRFFKIEEALIIIKEKPKTFNGCGFYFVESPRIELGSKQATKELSTRLVFYWFSIIDC